jgi:hypothetical protein
MKAMLALRWRYRLLMGLLPALSLNPTPDKSTSSCQLPLGNNQSLSSSNFLTNQTILGGNSLGTS